MPFSCRGRRADADHHRRAGGGVLEIQGNPGTTKVGDIRITGGTPKGPRGETLGMKWADADMDYPRCWMGKDRDAPRRDLHPARRAGAALRVRRARLDPGHDAARGGAARQGVLREFFWRGGAPTQ
jgi:hypothetical protein